MIASLSEFRSAPLQLAMATAPELDPSSSSSIFSHRNSKLPDDTVFYTLFPQASTTPVDTTDLSSSLQSLHLQILGSVSAFTSDYIWQHEPFNLSICYLTQSSCFCSSHGPHLHGKLRFGDNLEDEWFVVFLLFHISKNFPSLSIRVWDTDGEFLLIEAAFHLPRWINPENSVNRVFIYGGDLHIIPKGSLPNPSLVDSLKFLENLSQESRASESAQLAVKNKISDYPERAMRNVHRVKIRVPVSIAQVLKHEPCFISLAIEGFYDRDIDTMKFAAKMNKFLSKGREENLVCISAKMSRAMYAQLVQQTFQAPKCYPVLNRTDSSWYIEAELGMKVACGFEMMYEQRSRQGSEGKGSTRDAFMENLNRNGYFGGLLPGSVEYQRLMQRVENYYKNTSLYTKDSDVMSAPVRRIDEILAMPHSAENFNGQEVPASDDDSWLYNGEDELNMNLLARQKELELYNSKHKQKQKSKEKNDDQSFSSNVSESDLEGIAQSMQAFVKKVSSYQGAEVSGNRNLEEVDFDVNRFMKEMESVVKLDSSVDADIEDHSSSELDFDENETDGSDVELKYNGDEEDVFMESYSDAMKDELKTSTLRKSFIHVNEQSTKKDEGTSNAAQDMDEDFTPVDVDFNLVKSLLDSFSSQQGLPGPASNLLGLMGIQIPRDSDKTK